MYTRTLRNCAFALAFFFLAKESWSASPTFQALGYSGDLAVTTPTRLVSAATLIKPDASFTHLYFFSGIARDPSSGTIFLVANNLADTSTYVGELDFNTGVEKTIGIIPGELVGSITFDGGGNLYGLSTNDDDDNSQTLFAIDKKTAAASIVKKLDLHGVAKDFLNGTIAWNPADGSIYYANKESESHFFVDKLAPGTFRQTPVLSGGVTITSSVSMTFAAGRLWATDGIYFRSADARNVAKGFTDEGRPTFPTADVAENFLTRSIIPVNLPCVPSATAACLYNRFKVEVAYDARPQNGSGPGSVILENQESAKFSFLKPGSVELAVKILNDCAPPLKKWQVFVGGLTDLGASIKVTDTVGGAVKTYSNPKGRLLPSIADSFRCP